MYTPTAVVTEKTTTTTSDHYGLDDWIREGVDILQGLWIAGFFNFFLLEYAMQRKHATFPTAVILSLGSIVNPVVVHGRKLRGVHSDS